MMESCFFCGSTDLAIRHQRLAGVPHVVCQTCATFGKLAVDEGRLVRPIACQHVAAMELQHGLESFVPGLHRIERAESAIAARLNGGEFRDGCPCDSCRQLRSVSGLSWDQVADRLASGGYARSRSSHPEVVEFEVGGEVVVTDAGALTVQSLRGRSPRDRVTLPDGSVLPPDVALPVLLESNRRATEMPGDVRDRMALLAESVAPVWKTGGAYARREVARVTAARRYWALVKRYGPGHRDGSWWISLDGCAVELDGEESAWPVTQADIQDVRRDHLRAATWREVERDG